MRRLCERAGMSLDGVTLGLAEMWLPGLSPARVYVAFV